MMHPLELGERSSVSELQGSASYTKAKLKFKVLTARTRVGRGRAISVT